MSGSLAGWLAVEAWPTLSVLRRTPLEVERIARGRAAATLRAAAATPFGRERLQDAGLGVHAGSPALRDPFTAMRDIPPVSKAELRAAGDAALQGGRRDPSWHSTRSSGSTGEPFRVHYDGRAWAILKYLVKARARRACGVGLLDRLAVLDAMPPGAPEPSIGARAGRVRTVSVLQPADQVAQQLSAFAPDAIYGLPSALLEVSAALSQDRRSLRPRVVFTSGEILPSPTRETLVGAFGCPVLDVYGTSETKEIAWECCLGIPHLNADVVHLEVLNPAGVPVASGEEGDLVATLLVNRAMPLLRYRIGDRGTLRKGPCACGFPLPCMGVVAGRETEYLEIGGRRISPYLLTCALEPVDGMRRYRVAQRPGDRLRVEALVDPCARRTAAAGIRARIAAAVGPTVRVDVELVDDFPAGAGRKFRVVEPLHREAASQPR
ncbi:MAG: phenylacetate--CoA ligase family protein [Gemmatimonadetes bacterium]|nr:phenylacetate--CoA ligase family protein [Gemmatimonadota bacterium]